MGIVTLDPPWALVEHLERRLSIQSFVETGTYRGDTALQAAKRFKHVATIEASRELFGAVQERFSNQPSIHTLFGDTREQLSVAISKTEAPRLYWLDAHWSGGVTHGERDECPLLDELRIIAEKDPTAVILIDDARLFLSPPPRPHNSRMWPTIGGVVLSLPNRYTIVVYDVVVSVLERERSVLEEWAVNEATAIWDSYKTGRLSFSKRLRAHIKKRLGC